MDIDEVSIPDLGPAQEFVFVFAFIYIAHLIIPMMIFFAALGIAIRLDEWWTGLPDGGTTLYSVHPAHP